MEPAPGRPAHEADPHLGGEEPEWEREREDQHEEHDLRRGGAVGDQELGIAAEDVEQRLRHGERAEHGEVDAVPADRAGHERATPGAGEHGQLPPTPPFFTANDRAFPVRAHRWPD
jgi:hypothetical protein